MDVSNVLSAGAAVATIVGTVLLAANNGRRMTFAGFVIFVGASIAWCAVAILTENMIILAQNVVLLAINLVGVWRWYPHAVAAIANKQPGDDAPD